jgi:hypothetical protein
VLQRLPAIQKQVPRCARDDNNVKMMEMRDASSKDRDFSQAELDKFNALANRWRGESVRLRATGSRAGERTRMDARAGTAHHGRFGACR